MSNKKREIELKVRVSAETGYAGVSYHNIISVWVYESDSENVRERKKQAAAEAWLFDQIEFHWEDSDSDAPSDGDY